MKGVVFTEFLDMVEEKFSAEMVDDIIAAADLPHAAARWRIYSGRNVPSRRNGAPSDRVK